MSSPVNVQTITYQNFFFIAFNKKFFPQLYRHILNFKLRSLDLKNLSLKKKIDSSL